MLLKKLNNAKLKTWLTVPKALANRIPPLKLDNLPLDLKNILVSKKDPHQPWIWDEYKDTFDENGEAIVKYDVDNTISHPKLHNDFKFFTKTEKKVP